MPPRTPLRSRIPLCLAVIFLGLTCPGEPVHGQRLPLAPSDVELLAPRMADRLRQISAYLEAGQPREAAEAMRRLLSEGADRVARKPSEGGGAEAFPVYVPVRQVVFSRVAAWRAEWPEAYRLFYQRLDPIAEPAFRNAGDRWDPVAMRRVAQSYGGGRFGEAAAWAWGEMAYVQGDLIEARRAWESLDARLRVPEPPPPFLAGRGGLPWWYALTDDEETSHREDLLAWMARPREGERMVTVTPLPELRARLIWLAAVEGRVDRARWEWEWFRQLHPEAEGSLGGRTGNLAALLEDYLTEASSWPTVGDARATATFGGGPGRQPRHERPPDPRYAVAWQIDVPRLEGLRDWWNAARSRVGEDGTGLLSYHPVVWGDRLYVAQPGRIRAFSLQDGQPVAGSIGAPDPLEAGTIYRFDAPGYVALPEGEHAGVPRFRLSANEVGIYARVGLPQVEPGEQAPPELRGALAGWEPSTLKLRFDRIRPDEGWEFAGAPLVVGERLFAVQIRREDGLAQLRVTAHGARRGERLWVTPICRGVDGLPRALASLPHQAVTYRDGLLFVNTDLGVVAALESETGAPVWITGYPRELSAPDDPGGVAAPYGRIWRDGTPCLAWHDVIVVAPADSPQLFALRAATGRRLWSLPVGLAADVVHLLGVGPTGQLLVSGDALWWVDVRRGTITGRFPAMGVAAEGRVRGAPRGFGRGVLAGDRVFWPTRERIFVMDAGEPRLARQPFSLNALGLEGGNLLVAGDTLLIAGADRITMLAPAPRGGATRGEGQGNGSTRP